MTGKVRMLSVDIDGTIVFDRAISPADVAAMRRWREAGNLLVMNTGRSISALRSALDGFDVDYDYAVLYTGAVLTDGRAGVIEARTMPDGLIEEVLDVLGREERITIFATTLDGDLQLHDTLGSGTDLLTLFRRGTTADLAGRAVVGIPLHLGDAAATDRIEAEVARRWGGVQGGGAEAARGPADRPGRRPRGRDDRDLDGGRLVERHPHARRGRPRRGHGGLARGGPGRLRAPHAVGGLPRRGPARRRVRSRRGAGLHRPRR